MPGLEDLYREIILERPDSDWRFYANFRFAMSIVAGLRGPDYDLDGMKVAATELRTFLRTATENPGLVREAEQALARVLAWQVRRHLEVAAYYRTLNNQQGQLHHARLATQEEFEGAPGYDEATALLEQLEAEQAAANRGNNFGLASDDPAPCIGGRQIRNGKRAAIRPNHIFDPRSNQIGHRTL